MVFISEHHNNLQFSPCCRQQQPQQIHKVNLLHSFIEEAAEIDYIRNRDVTLLLSMKANHHYYPPLLPNKNLLIRNLNII